eukprot:scaffold82774_cov48-Phaeocystis_antarctica.AAC.1
MVRAAVARVAAARVPAARAPATAAAAWAAAATRAETHCRPAMNAVIGFAFVGSEAIPSSVVSFNWSP